MKLIPERRLVMTFALRQALEVLQMPQLELAQWLQDEIERNPLLELDPVPKKNFNEIEIPAKISLYDHLMAQIREIFICEKDRAKAEELLNNLDERGFITCDADSKILSILQTLDPPGIFARNLQEALLIQLVAIGKKNSLAYELVQQCFEDLLQGRYKAIKNKLGFSALGHAIQTLAHLSLRPAQDFKHDPISPIVPDLLIDKIDKGWTLETYEDELPKFHIQTEYFSAEVKSEEEKEILNGFKTQAKWIVRSLSRRRKLLREIGRILICKQANYLDQKGPLNALTIKELAGTLHLHESTLSRALAGKYASTPRGIIPLRSLVTASPTTETAKEILEQLIQNEDGEEPLTDDQLALKLQEKGFRIARRTIAKYRTQLKISPASKRKMRRSKK